jgi:hypothetical protein
MTADEMAVWNRAALQFGGASPREGDAMLSALLAVHGLIMNGGVMHMMVAVTEEELEAACSGYRYFGFLKAAELLAAASQEEWTGESERRLDGGYAELVDDHAIGVRFLERMATERGLFAP